MDVVSAVGGKVGSYVSSECKFGHYIYEEEEQDRRKIKCRI